MYANQETINQVQKELGAISRDHPELYARIEHVTSFARQLQVKYRYLADLITGEAREPQPAFIKLSVLNILIDEVEKLQKTPGFEVFCDLLNRNRHTDAPEIFLLILGAKPEAVVNNAIIS
ncbi:MULTISPECIES: hypothetical protein [Salinicoccus]|uniref:Uncharacterized protein n=1 Tax=Salinicoccus roseus TaxID=45670 RepID=A0A0C2E7X4_9STAP|nr:MULTISPECIES: hypothetical protein [Salinicoccus]KIH71377.1 hypothetical protein SN16_01425 [Salinicoccus roseus]MCC4722295.1 hypothetical protein [Salinicoccus sp. RF5]MDB0579431.1 hypothetical protein [Salinicoccus roseus]